MEVAVRNGDQFPDKAVVPYLNGLHGNDGNIVGESCFLDRLAGRRDWSGGLGGIPAIRGDLLVCWFYILLILTNRFILAELL